MKSFIKRHWKTIFCFTVVGLVGGFFAGFYALKGYSEEMRQEMLARGLTPTLVSVVTAVQTAGYGLILGTLGILLWLFFMICVNTENGIKYRMVIGRGSRGSAYRP